LRSIACWLVGAGTPLADTLVAAAGHVKETERGGRQKNGGQPGRQADIIGVSPVLDRWCRVQRTLVMIPAYNEAESVAAVVAEVRAALPEATVLVINDGSTDQTAARAAEAGATVLDLAINLGIGGAVQAGYRYAARHGYERMVRVDADGQHPAGEIAKLFDRLDQGDVDLVIGSRFLEAGEDGFRPTRLRRIGIRFYAGLIGLITRRRVTDPTSGFRAANRATIERFADRYPEDYPEPESLVYAHRLGLRVVEVPVTMAERRASASTINTPAGAYYAIKVTLAILIDLLRSQRRRRS
jgi:glycosyltransferase involved in cell wall biosynthesis